jgi:hypothetical protein
MKKNILLVAGIAAMLLGIPRIEANAVPRRDRIEERRHLRVFEHRRYHNRHERLRYLRVEGRRRHRDYDRYYHDRRHFRRYDRGRIL